MPRSNRIAPLFLLFACAATGDHARAQAPIADVADAPQPAGPAADWDRAEVLHHQDYEALPPGANPPAWAFGGYYDGARTEPPVVRRTRDGGHVLNSDCRGAWWLPLRTAPTSGRLLIAFDMHVVGDAPGYVRLALQSAGQPVDHGYPVPVEHGPCLVATWPGGEVASLDNRGRTTALGTLERNRWHRFLLVADLDAKTFTLQIDGAQRRDTLRFRDHRWFTAADRLFFYTKCAVLLDNATVRHQGGDGRAGAADALGERPPPAIPARRLGAVPVLDGKLEDAAWRDAFHTERFFALSGEPAADPRTEVWLGYRDDAIYLATRVWPRDIAGVRRGADDPDAKAGWKAIEIFIDPSLATQDGKYLHLGYDAAGRRIQEQGMGDPWRSSWTVVTHIGADCWSAEARIPFADLTSACPPMETWGINVCRGERAGPDNAALSPTFGGFHVPQRFARLTGLRRTITSPLRCVLVAPEPFFTGSATVTAVVSGPGSADTRLRIEMSGAGPDGADLEEVRTFRRAAGAEQRIGFDVDVVRPGPYAFHARVRPDDDTEDAGFPLAISPTILPRAIARGTLEARTDLDYYTHEPEARVRGRVLGRVLPPGSRVVAVVHAGTDAGEGTTGPLLEVTGAAETDPFMIRLPLAKLPLGASRLQLKVLSDRDGPLATAELPLVRRVPRHNAVKIRWDNILVVDDEPFFPLFIWSKRDVIQAHDLGCNAILMPYSKLITPQVAALAHDRGIRIIARPSHVYRAQSDAPGVIRHLRDEPALLAWFMEDEPHFDNEKQPEAIMAMRRMLADMDPYHPTFLNMMVRWQDMQFYAFRSDIFGTDPYASSRYYREWHVGRATRMCAAATRGRQPIWQTLQAFHNRLNHVNPTPAEFRHSVHAAIVHGATGVGLWGTSTRNGGADEDIRGLLSDPDLWQEARRVLRSVRRLIPVLVSEEPVRQPAVGDNDAIALMTRRWQGALYVWAVNMGTGPQRLTLEVGEAEGRLTNQVRPGGSWPLHEGRCDLAFEPLQPMVLRLD